jgi:hypothetical protein
MPRQGTRLLDPAASHGALDLPFGHLGEEYYRRAVAYHPALCVEDFLEADVLEVGTEVLFVVYRTFTNHVRQKPTQRIIGGNTVGLKRHRPPQATSHLAQ